MPPPPFGSLFAAREGGRGAHHDVGLGAPPPARRGFEPVCGRSGADDVGRASIGPNRASVSSGCSWRSDDDREGEAGGRSGRRAMVMMFLSMARQHLKKVFVIK